MTKSQEILKQLARIKELRAQRQKLDQEERKLFEAVQDAICQQSGQRFPWATANGFRFLVDSEIVNISRDSLWFEPIALLAQLPDDPPAERWDDNDEIEEDDLALRPRAEAEF